MNDRQKLLSLCVDGMKEKGVYDDERYRERLKKEIRQIDLQGKHEYFLGLYDKFRKEKLTFPKNEFNLLVDWILKLAPDFDINCEYAYFWGELPDIDTDFIRIIRDNLKRVWAPKRFGREFVCEVGTYGTSGIKGATIDMARVHGLDIHEVQMITTKMKDKFADEEGNTKLLDWDTALKMYPEFKAYCDKHPAVAVTARLLQDRNRTGGVHAGGLIISSVPIDGFVPLEVRMVNKENPNGVICSAWTEGLNAQDLQPVGLVKLDLLVISNLMQIAWACHLIKQRHGLEHVCNLSGSWDWSDTCYLNDPEAIAMADKADLRCVFQFDSEGIRKLVRRGGVARFDDLAVYTSIYRPGPLACLPGRSKVTIKTGEKEISNLKNWSDEIAYVNRDGKISYSSRFALWKTKKKKIVRVRTKSGKVLECSTDHRILCEGEKYKATESLKLGEKIAVANTI